MMPTSASPRPRPLRPSADRLREPDKNKQQNERKVDANIHTEQPPAGNDQLLTRLDQTPAINSIPLMKVPRRNARDWTIS